MPPRRPRPHNIPWMRDAACLEHPPEWWFPPTGGSAKVAKEICTRCLVRAECLEYAVANNERQGVWGGFNQTELGKVQRPRPCPGCHAPIPLPEVAAFVLRKVERRRWICRRCRYREIQGRKRA